MKIIIPGNPIPQARMRHSNFRGFATTYDPNSKDKKVIRACIQSQCKADLQRFDYPRISFLFYMPIPKSTPKKVLPLYESGLLKHTKKPDIDNLVKLYLDCLDGIVIHQDQKCSLGSCVKVYHTDPKSIIWIHETTHIVSAQDIDVASLDALECTTPISYELDFPCGF